LYLVDTNIISAIAPLRRRAPAPLIAWLDRETDRLFLSARTIAEIEEGIAKNRREHARREAGELQEWLEAILRLYASCLLPVDLHTAPLIGVLSDLARSKGRPPGLADIIVATAQEHRLTVLTRNLRHFAPLGIPAIDPYETLPS
jgi:predicted nucleic acid-binding protein